MGTSGFEDSFQIRPNFSRNWTRMRANKGLSARDYLRRCIGAFSVSRPLVWPRRAQLRPLRRRDPRKGGQATGGKR